MGTPGVKGKRNISPTSVMRERGAERRGGQVRWEGWSERFVGSSWDSQPWATCLVQGDFGASLLCN